MEFQKCSHFYQFYSYFTSYTNQLVFNLEDFSTAFYRSALSSHFENEPSVDVVRSMSPQTVRNYDCVINIMWPFSTLATQMEFKNRNYLQKKKLFPSPQCLSLRVQ